MFLFQTPPAPRHRDQGYGTLPANPSASESNRSEPMRAAHSQTLQPRSGTVLQVHPSPTLSRSRVAGKPPKGAGHAGGHSAGSSSVSSGFASFGKGLRKLGRNKWSSSAPNLGDSAFWCLSILARSLPPGVTLRGLLECCLDDPIY